MRTLLLAVLALTVAFFLAVPRLLAPPAAAAHPLGNFTVSRYSRVELTPGLVRVRYVVDMAEIPTFQERAAIDTNHDGRIDDAEAASYAEREGEQILRNMRLAVEGRAVALHLAEHEISFPEGQGGLNTLRLGLWYEGNVPALSGAVSAEYGDDNFLDRIGWKEIVVRGGPGIDVTGASVSESDISNELTTYPEDLLQRPLDQRSARFNVAPGAGKALTAPASGTTVTRKKDRFSELVTRRLTLPVVLFSLLLAMGLGAMHALGPGHGKTVVAAYLVGSRGTTKHAVFLGLTVTLTHTSSVFALGFVALELQRYILPEQLFPWLSFLSGAGIAVLGFVLLVRRARILLRGRRPTPVTAHHHAEALVPSHAHAHATLQPQAHGRMRFHTSEPDHEHPHEHGHDYSHDHARVEGAHSHGGRVHSHLPPGADGERVTWQSLLALGITGGILPCPSALVVLLTAISLHRVGYGMLLILAFSVGLAGVLTAVGLLLVHARGLFSRLPVDSIVARVLPVLSAGAVTVLGAAIAFRALTGGSNISL